jgi:hypothetical protein
MFEDIGRIKVDPCNSGTFLFLALEAIKSLKGRIASPMDPFRDPQDEEEVKEMEEDIRSLEEWALSLKGGTIINISSVSVSLRNADIMLNLLNEAANSLWNQAERGLDEKERLAREVQKVQNRISSRVRGGR